MGNNVVVFRLYSPSGTSAPIYTLFRPAFNLLPWPNNSCNKEKPHPGFISKYINEQNNFSDEEKEIEVIESPDYEPFMANFRKYKPEMTQVEKEDILTRGLINLRFNPHMRDIMVKMFDYDLEVSDLEVEIFLVKEKIEIVFNFFYASFQLLDGPFEKTVALLNKQMVKLRNYYDRKATHNMAQAKVS